VVPGWGGEKLLLTPFPVEKAIAAAMPFPPLNNSDFSDQVFLTNRWPIFAN
jgi:hypothetical protein